MKRSLGVWFKFWRQVQLQPVGWLDWRLSERPKLFHHRASGIARCSDYRNRHRRILPIVGSCALPVGFCGRNALYGDSFHP